MKIITAIFDSSLKAHRARSQLRVSGFKKKQITLLTPVSSQVEVAATPTSDGEQPGMGRTIGVVVGAAAGLWGGSLLAILAALPLYSGKYLFLLLTGALLGAIVGALAGSALENALTKGLPRDELFFYQDELRDGRSVLVVSANRQRQLRIGRAVLEGSGASALNAARKLRWIGIMRNSKLKIQN